MGVTFINPFLSAAGSPPAFTPADLFGVGDLGGWWDGADLSTLFQSNAGTTAVTAANDVVGYWGDKSGNGNHMLSAADDTSRPTYQTDGIDFDGSNDVLLTTFASNITSSELTCFCVFILNTDTDGRRVVSFSTSTSDNDYDDTVRANVITRRSGGGTFSASRNGGWVGERTGSNATWYIAESVFDGTNHTMTLNGLSGTPVSSTGSFAADTLVLARMAPSWEPCTDCRIAEVVFIDRALTTGEHDDLYTYLSDKWGVG